jgi:hypothetical protein
MLQQKNMQKHQPTMSTVQVVIPVFQPELIIVLFNAAVVL